MPKMTNRHKGLRELQNANLGHSGAFWGMTISAEMPTRFL